MATGWYVVEPPTEGLLNAVKGQPARALLVGQNTYSGSLTASVKAALANFQGGQFVSGVATMLAKPPQASMNGIFFNGASMDITVKKATAAMVGTSQNRATLVSTIAKATAALNGSQTAIGIIAATTAKASATMNTLTGLSSELLQSNGFESGFGYWYATTGVAIDSTVAKSGVNSARLDPSSTNTYPLIVHGLGGVQAGDYIFSIWYKNDANVDGRVGLQFSYTPLSGGPVKFLNENLFWQTADTVTRRLPYSSVWTKYDLKFQIPEAVALNAANGLNLQIFSSRYDTSADYSVWVDDISFKQYVSGSQGNAPITLAKASASLAGSMVHSGVLAGMLKPIGSAMAGYQNPQGDLVGVAKPASAAMNGTQNMVATFAAALKAAQAAIVSEQAQSGAATMSAKAASFGAVSVSPITVNSIGAYVRNAPNSSNFNVVLNISVVAGNNRRLIVPVHISNANWLNSYNAGKPSGVSSIDGALSQISLQLLGNSSGNRQGAICVLELVNPSVGDHVITVNLTASQTVGSMGAQPICFNEVVSRSAPVTQAITGTVADQSIAIPTTKATDMAFIASAINEPGFTALTGEWAITGGIFCNKQGLSTSGEGDWLYAAYSQGDGTTKNFTATATVRHASIGFNLVGP